MLDQVGRTQALKVIIYHYFSLWDLCLSPMQFTVYSLQQEELGIIESVLLSGNGPQIKPILDIVNLRQILKKCVRSKTKTDAKTKKKRPLPRISATSNGQRRNTISKRAFHTSNYQLIVYNCVDSASVQYPPLSANMKLCSSTNRWEFSWHPWLLVVYTLNWAVKQGPEILRKGAFCERVWKKDWDLIRYYIQSQVSILTAQWMHYGSLQT